MPLHEIKGFFDGGFRDNTVYYGFSVKNSENKTIASDASKFDKRGSTSVIAEYMGLILLLSWCAKNSVQAINIYGDSEIVIKQIKKEYKTKDECQKVLLEVCNHFLKQIPQYTLSWIPRDFNSEADKQTR